MRQPFFKAMSEAQGAYYPRWAAMVLNQQYNSEYEDIVWTKSLDRSEFMVLHMLGVHSDFAEKGLAEEVVRFAIHTAETAGMKAIRLHVPKGNVPGILS